MNTAIELHDSVLDSISIYGGNIEIAIRPACVHVSEGDPGNDDGWYFVQDAVIEFQEATLTGDIGMLEAEVIGGVFQADGVITPNMINVLCAAAHEAVLHLDLAPDGRRISIVGKKASVKLTGESGARFEFPPLAS